MFIGSVGFEKRGWNKLGQESEPNTSNVLEGRKEGMKGGEKSPFVRMFRHNSNPIIC